MLDVADSGPVLELCETGFADAMIAKPFGVCERSRLAGKNTQPLTFRPDRKRVQVRRTATARAWGCIYNHVPWPGPSSEPPTPCLIILGTQQRSRHLEGAAAGKIMEQSYEHARCADRKLGRQGPARRCDGGGGGNNADLHRHAAWGRLSPAPDICFISPTAAAFRRFRVGCCYWAWRNGFPILRS